MNVFFQKALEHINFFIDHPSESSIILIVSVSISFVIVNYVYRERIATLDERIKLRDDRVEFYKSLNMELEKQVALKTEISQNLEIPTKESDKQKERITQPHQTVEPVSTNKIRTSLLEAIADTESKGVSPASMKIIQSMQPQYELEDILSELIRMYQEQLLTWNNAPNLPEHWMELKLNKS